LVKLPPFEIWFATTIVESQAIGEEVLRDMISLIIPPSILATTYHFMYAFGNHLSVANVKHHLATSNSRVATTFEQKCVYHSNGGIN
jgi:hypothetical protein